MVLKHFVDFSVSSACSNGMGFVFFWKEGSASFNKNFIDDFVEQRRDNEKGQSRGKI
jgi:hypothetical protein